MFLSFLQFEHTSMNLHIHALCSRKIKINLKESSEQVKRISNDDDRHFAQKLIEYCEKREKESRFFSDNLGTMMKRSNYVLNIIEALVNDEANKVKKMLSEENILPFKGYFSQVFYSLLKEKRSNIYGIEIEPVVPSRWRPC